MGLSEMVGSIGLTLFCNRWVELLHEFRENGVVTEELKTTSERSVRALKSLKWPTGGELLSDERMPLFNTSEEVKSFAMALSSQSEQVDQATLNKWIQKLENMLAEGIDVSQKKNIAMELQKFFDTLGDYSFYATRESLRSSVTTLGV